MNIRFSFQLKNPLSQQRTSIRLVIYYKYFRPSGRLLYGTGQSVAPEFFDPLTERPVKDRELLKKLSREEQRTLLLLEDKLNSIQAAARKICEQLEFHNQPFETNDFREKLTRELGKQQFIPDVPSSITLNGYLDSFIREIEDGKRLTGGGRVFENGSVKNYHTFRSQFLLYQEKIKKLDFMDIDQDFYNSFICFLNEKKYSPNTIGKHISRLKKILRSAKEDGLYAGAEHEKKYFKTLEEETEHVYLTENELKRLKDLDLKNDPELDLYRDVFLIGCHIAQRVSDYKSIRPEHISSTSKGVRILKLIQKKTGEEVLIPISRELECLLKKYNYNTPKVYEQKLNEAIKEIGKKAEIDSPVEIEMIRGGKKLRKVYPKYQLIKTHTARRTGATNMYLADIPPIDIMKLTGHRKESNFLKYIRVSKEETADKLSLHPYFT